MSHLFPTTRRLLTLMTLSQWSGTMTNSVASVTFCMSTVQLSSKSGAIWVKCLGPWCSPDKAGLCCSCSLTDLGSQSAKEETGKIAKLEIRTQISKSKNLKGKVIEYQRQGVWSIGVLRLQGSFWDFRGPQRLSCTYWWGWMVRQEGALLKTHRVS